MQVSLIHESGRENQLPEQQQIYSYSRRACQGFFAFSTTLGSCGLGLLSKRIQSAWYSCFTGKEWLTDRQMANVESVIALKYKEELKEVDQSFSKAIEHYLLSAIYDIDTEGSQLTHTLLIIGNIYENTLIDEKNLGTPKHDKDIIKLYRREAMEFYRSATYQAADKKDIGTLMHLADLYEKGRLRLELSDTEARHCYVLAAVLGSTEAIRNLQRMYKADNQNAMISEFAAYASYCSKELVSKISENLEKCYEEITGIKKLKEGDKKRKNMRKRAEKAWLRAKLRAIRKE